MHMKCAVASACLLVFGTISCAPGQAPAPRPADRQLKIVVIEFQPAVTSTNEFQRDLAELQKKFEPKRTELKTLSDEIDRLTKQLQSDGEKPSEAQQASRARTIENKKKQAQRLAEDAQNEYNEALQNLFGRIAGKVEELLTAYAKDHGYTLVMDRAEQDGQTPVVLYASDSTDITRQIVDAYNAKSGVAAQSEGLPSAPRASPSH